MRFAIAASSMVALLLLVCGCGPTDGQLFYQNYKKLRIGIPKATVKSLFGPKPTYECTLGNYDIWYYRDRGWATGEFPTTAPKIGSNFERATDLPDTFGHLQFAFDQNDELYAFTWIGETETIESKPGSVRGSHFKELPPATLK